MATFVVCLSKLVSYHKYCSVQICIYLLMLYLSQSVVWGITRYIVIDALAMVSARLCVNCLQRAIVRQCYLECALRHQEYTEHMEPAGPRRPYDPPSTEPV